MIKVIITLKGNEANPYAEVMRREEAINLHHSIFVKPHPYVTVRVGNGEVTFRPADVLSLTLG
ncbi:hypothetical protein [Pantanalinema sp. GBBB05]|uniref:hypothetical protein n=1 Tax=Pantanalinema sp. GBBB05 TaxID=2604139 RepID=UPI001E0CE74D|nr:hypothetical protein [Pantanalinema sp. GBBB05]